MLYTLISFINDIKTNFADIHLGIKSFDYGFYDELNAFTTKNELYAKMYIVISDVDHLENSVAQYNIRAYFIDLVENDNDNEKEVLSDQLSISRDFINWLRLNEDSFAILNTPTSVPFKSIDTDYVAGWYTDLSLEVATEGSDCSIPFTGITGTTIACPLSYVLNSDDSYSVILDSGDTLILPNIIISSTGTGFTQTIPSVQNYTIQDVDWTDSDGSLMSSEYGEPIVCQPVSPVNLLINGVQSEVLNSGTNFNLIALLNGVSGGTYSASADTLSFTTDPLAVRSDYIEATETQYIGFGFPTTIDTDIITIKRNIRNPSTGVITTAYATDTWNNHLTATYT